MEIKESCQLLFFYRVNSYQPSKFEASILYLLTDTYDWQQKVSYLRNRLPVASSFQKCTVHYSLISVKNQMQFTYLICPELYC